MKKCKEYDKDNMDPAIIEKLKPLTESDAYDISLIAGASKAAAGLADYIQAMVGYDEAMKVVKPLLK